MNELGNNSIEWVWRENHGNVCESQKTKLGQIGGAGRGRRGGVSSDFQENFRKSFLPWLQNCLPRKDSLI